MHQRLKAVAIARKTGAGYYADGDGLYLQVTGKGAKSWIYRDKLGGRRRAMGLGALSDVSLAQARGKAAAARMIVKAGQDPIEAREAERERLRLADARSIAFDAAARLYIADHEPTWGVRHAEQWKSTLAAYASPKVGTLAVGSIGTPEVTSALDPIWHEMPETV
jgi:Arm DNA-binding domain